MNINSVSSYSPFNYGNLSIANGSKSTEDESNVEGAKKGPGGPGGPKGAGGPPPGGGKGPKEPDLDTDTDGVWSKDEVSEYAATSEASLDVDDIFSKYDTDEDGNINASERKSLAGDNALKLSNPQDIAKAMMAGNQRSIPMVSTDDDEEDDESSIIDALSESNILDSLNESFVAQYIEAYQSSSDYKNQDTSSLFDLAM